MGDCKKMKPQVKTEHYSKQLYDIKERFISYWHQVDEAIKLNTKNILEIGPGNGFVSRYLKEKGQNNTTLDIDINLKPDTVGSVTEIPFLDNSFEAVTCYEVLEHIPYNSFIKALKEIYRVATTHVILSLPDVTTVYRFNIELPRINPIKKLINHPFHRPIQHIFDGEHYWEIGKTDFSLKRVELDIKRCGLKIIKTYRVFEFYYHRFFILEKI